ncbi:hypothetical protein [Streptomyces sp. Mo3]|uniref:hypothetical protein n=1 Tax=Streptomyces sp. Mo3 TaxID=3161190 RepID=UPI0039F0D6FA
MPLAVEQGDFERALAAPGWLVSGTAADGVVRVVNHGGDHSDPARPHADDPGYARFAYSTHTAPETPGDPTVRGGSADADPLDNAVVLLDEAGRASHRRPATRISLDGTTAVSRSRAHWLDDATWDVFGGPDAPYVFGPWITVGSALRGSVEVRAVRVDPAPEDESAAHVLRVGGWALVLDKAPEESGTARVRGADGLVSLVVGARGLPHSRTVTGAESNALGPLSATPVVETGGAVAHGTLHVALIHLGGTDPTALPDVTTRAEGADLLADVTWPDGGQDTIRLPAPNA